METTLAIVSGLGIAGVAVLGILYGLTQRKVSDLTIQLADLRGIEKRADRLARIVIVLESQILALQKENYDEMSEDELVDTINRIFDGSLLSDPDGTDSN